MPKSNSQETKSDLDNKADSIKNGLEDDLLTKDYLDKRLEEFGNRIISQISKD